MARIALTYQLNGTVIVDTDPEVGVVEATLDVYDYGEPIYIEYDNSDLNDPKPTAEEVETVKEIVGNEGLNWEFA